MCAQVGFLSLAGVEIHSEAGFQYFLSQIKSVVFMLERVTVMWPEGLKVPPHQALALTLKWTVTQGWVERSEQSGNWNHVTGIHFCGFSCSFFPASLCVFHESTHDTQQILVLGYARSRLGVRTKAGKERVFFYKQPRIGESLLLLSQGRTPHTLSVPGEKNQGVKKLFPVVRQLWDNGPGRLSLSTLSTAGDR